MIQRLLNDNNICYNENTVYTIWSRQSSAIEDESHRATNNCVRESLHLPEAGEERQRCGRANLVAVVNAQIYLAQIPDMSNVLRFIQSNKLMTAQKYLTITINK